jgi:hypothetical protein
MVLREPSLSSREEMEETLTLTASSPNDLVAACSMVSQLVNNRKRSPHPKGRSDLTRSSLSSFSLRTSITRQDSRSSRFHGIQRSTCTNRSLFLSSFLENSTFQNFFEKSLCWFTQTPLSSAQVQVWRLIFDPEDFRF